MKVLFALGSMSPYARQRLEELKTSFPNTAFVLAADKETRKVELKDAHVTVAGGLSEEELASAEKLQAVFVPFTGINRFPLQQMERRGVALCNSHAKARFIAERAFALALAVLGRVVEMHNLMKDQGMWLTRQNWGKDYWSTLFGKRCAIYGLGSIGEQLIPMLRPFGCEIIALERDRDKNLADVYVGDLVELAATADILFVCVPLTATTAGSIDEKILGRMEGKYLVNIARGQVVEEEALYKALQEGVLAGAGLDVWYEYPRPPYEEAVRGSRYPFWQLPNVVMSPHAAAHAREDKDAYFEDTFNQLEYFLENNKPLRAVDISRRF